jgi:lipid-binding SYLF domain-containing protein
VAPPVPRDMDFRESVPIHQDDSSKYMSLTPCTHASPGYLATVRPKVDTWLTYHRTWETGVGHGHEGRHIQPFILFLHLTPELLLRLKSISRNIMKKLPSVLLFALIVGNLSFAESAAGRIESAATVLNEIMATPDSGIPEEIMGSAKCIAVVPSLIKVGFVAGAAHGRGVASCRLQNGWSAPAPFSLTGGSFGFQIGGQAVDLVMMIMNERGMQALLSSKFKLGADASAAAGPVGRHAEGSTDWKMRAEVLTYSRARGLFAGVTVNGSWISQDEDATKELYGRMVPFKTILTGAVATPGPAEPFVAAIRKALGTTSSASSPPQKSNVPVNPPPAAKPVPVSTTAPAAETPAQPAAPADTPPADAQPTPAPTPPLSLQIKPDDKADGFTWAMS